jgi:hypothetical protein
VTAVEEAARPGAVRIPGPGAAAALRQLIMGFRTTQLVYAAAKLGLADALQDGPQDVAHLAAWTGSQPHTLRRLLRALTSLGIVAETSDGRFTSTALSGLLQSDAAGSLRNVAVLYGDEWLWRVYGRTLYSVQTGRPAFQEIHGESFYRYLNDHPDAARVFHDAMSAFSAQEAQAILNAYDFSTCGRVVDVGGGEGLLLRALLQAHPHLSGVLCDLAPAVAEAQRLFADSGLADRASCLAGDFFTAIPDGGDLYLLKSILHNWEDADAVQILRTCRTAMARDARLLVAERVIPDGNEPAEAKLFDINMLVVVGGRERTAPEYGTLLKASGFSLTRIVPTESPLSLIEAVSSEQ